MIDTVCDASWPSLGLNPASDERDVDLAAL